MIIGLSFMGYTRFIQSKMPAAKLSLFFWVGIAFLVFGIVREFLPRIMARKERKEPVGPPQQSAAHKPAPAHPALHPHSPHLTHQHVQPHQHPSHPYQPLHKQCPRCHQLTHGQGRFCHSCGHQFY